VDVEPIEKQLKVSCLICMDEIKLEISNICGHIFCQDYICNIINAKKYVPYVRKNLILKMYTMSTFNLILNIYFCFHLI
jgi:hypothetical protein